jgi:hypothetical protein
MECKRMCLEDEVERLYQTSPYHLTLVFSQSNVLSDGQPGQ